MTNNSWSDESLSRLIACVCLHRCDTMDENRMCQSFTQFPHTSKQHARTQPLCQYGLLSFFGYSVAHMCRSEHQFQHNEHVRCMMNFAIYYRLLFVKRKQASFAVSEFRNLPMILIHLCKNPHFIFAVFFVGNLHRHTISEVFVCACKTGNYSICWWINVRGKKKNKPNICPRQSSCEKYFCVTLLFKLN